MRRLILLAVFAPLALRAQGTLTSQGFGYPAGQFGARAAGSAGALGPFDPVSTLNPATVALWQYGVIFFHVEPEYRSTQSGGVSATTRTSRFPLAGGAAKLGSKLLMGLTFSTYLDRTYETHLNTTESIGGQDVDVVTRQSSAGAINDVRLAAGYNLNGKVRIGIGYHAYTGENRLGINWDFPDSVPFGDIAQSSTLAYSGKGVSAGIEWSALRHVGVSAYGRWGGGVKLRTGDTLLASANMPDHQGLALRYDGIKGTLVAAGWERITWSSLAPLGSASLGVKDADRISAGVETRGPNVGKSPMALRLGFAQRDLPFTALGQTVQERLFSIGGGFKLELGSGLANVDIALQRANRTAPSAKEHAWFLTFGLAITPERPVQR
jgi:hypothetical protein